MERSTTDIFNRINKIEIKSTETDIQNEESNLNPDFLMKSILKEDCSNRNSCNTCVENSSCVWCSIKNKCVVGDANGPNDNTCGNSFIHLRCPMDSCDSIRNCKECLKNMGCGWCKSQTKCVAGDANKPKKGVCINGYFHKNKLENQNNYNFC